MEGSGWSKADSFLIAQSPCVHGIDLAVVVLAELWSSPSVVVELRTEQVVEGNAYTSIPDSPFPQAEAVAQVDIRSEVVLQHERFVCSHVIGLAPVAPAAHGLHAIVSEILFPHVLALYGCTPAFVVQRENIIENDVGREAFEQQYGEWSWFESQFAGNHDKDDVEETTYILTSPIYLGEFNMMVPTGDYRLIEDEGVVKVMRKDSTVLTYPIGERLRKNPKMLDNPDSLFVCRNDSLMLVLESVSVENDRVTTINTYEFQLFRKRK